MIVDFQLKSSRSKSVSDISLNLGDRQCEVGYNEVIRYFALNVLRIMGLYLQKGGVNHVKERTRNTI